MAPRARKGPTKLPSAFVKNALAKKDARLAALAERGFAAIAKVKALRTSIADDFVEMGEALATLKDPDVWKAVGAGSFEDVVTREFDMSLARAESLLALWERLSAELVRELGVDRASALLDLADATPEDDDVPGLLHATLTLPSGAKLDVAKASVAQLHDAATEFRRARVRPKGKKTHGFTVDAAAQKKFEAATKRLHRLVGTHVTTKLVATRKKTGADATLRLPLADLVKLLAAAAKGAS